VPNLIPRHCVRQSHRNLAFEARKKRLNDEIKVRAIETAQILQELIDLAKQMREADKRGEDLGFTTEELAFYDAVEVNDGAVKVLGDEKPSPANSSTPSTRTLPSTGPKKRASKPSFAPWSSAFFASAATPPTSRKKPPPPSSNKPICCAAT